MVFSLFPVSHICCGDGRKVGRKSVAVLWRSNCGVRREKMMGRWEKVASRSLGLKLYSRAWVYARSPSYFYIRLFTHLSLLFHTKI